MALVSLRSSRRPVPVFDPDAFDPRDLAEALGDSIEGEVRFDPGARALYATDASNFRHVPVGVVVPRTIDDVVATIACCRERGVAILSRGGGTSLAGQGCNAAVVIDFSAHLHRVLEIDAARRRARVQPGCVLDDLRNAATAQGLTFGPDPSTHNRCTLGGMLGNDSCGVHSVLSEFYGPGPRTHDNVEELDIVTYGGLRLRVGATSPEERQAIIGAGGRRGELYAQLQDFVQRWGDLIRARYPKIPRRVSGYDLPALLPENGFHVARALVGSESTLVTIVEATVSLVDAMPGRALVVLGYPSVFEAADHIPAIRELRPVGCEGIDRRLIEDVRHMRRHEEGAQLLPRGDGWLLVEFGGATATEAADRAIEAMHEIRRHAGRPTMELYTDPHEQGLVWAIRESGLAATAFIEGVDHWPGWEDAAVSPERLGEYLREFRALLDEHGYACSLYGHFAQGCVHTRIDFSFKTEADIERYATFTRRAAELVVAYGGSLSGEHGDGQQRSDLLDVMFGKELVGAFAEFKAIWDPDGRMNPGRIVEPASRLADLRIGPENPRIDPPVHFAYEEDGGSFRHATHRCVGVGECRKQSGGTMCPSYRATRDEEHVTRGRAHLLFEMLRGDVIADGWKSDEVHDALELCLACKGCTAECPVNVDMPTYKAEFLAHYHESRRRPRQAYAFGLIRRWARIARHAPRLVNAVAHAPGLSGLAKLASGTAPKRSIPRFAEETFVHWFRRRPAPTHDGPRVVIWPDTFNDHFFPQTLAAAVCVLESAGARVELPPVDNLCCGRPLYDYGMLDVAKKRWREILDALEPIVAEGVPIVGAEPSCVAAFRDELVKLMPGDPRSKRLSSNVHTLAEYLCEHRGKEWSPPSLQGRHVMLHRHCHHQAVMGTDVDRALLEKTGADLEVLDSGCCGMAGSFGFERGRKYEVSMAVGERVLLPRVREADAATIVVADGFSCREQVVHATGRRPQHLAEVLWLASQAPRLAVEGDARDDAIAHELGIGTSRIPPRAAAAAAAFGLVAFGWFLLTWMGAT